MCNILPPRLYGEAALWLQEVFESIHFLDFQLFCDMSIYIEREANTQMYWS